MRDTANNWRCGLSSENIRCRRYSMGNRWWRSRWLESKQKFSLSFFPPVTADTGHGKYFSCIVAKGVAGGSSDNVDQGRYSRRSIPGWGSSILTGPHCCFAASVADGPMIVPRPTKPPFTTYYFLTLVDVVQNRACQRLVTLRGTMTISGISHHGGGLLLICVTKRQPRETDLGRSSYSH